MVLVVDDSNSNPGKHFFKTVDEGTYFASSLTPVRVAFDCEGARLSRAGTVEVVSFCFNIPVTTGKEVFLVYLNC